MNESLHSAPRLEKTPEEIRLEEQFNHLETLQIGNHAIRVLDLTPEELKTPIPAILAPSYGSLSPLGKKVNLLELARQKRRVMFIDEPRGINRKTDYENTDTIEEFFLQQTEALMAVLDEKHIDKADVIGHSEGCIYAVAAASLYPERFRNMVLFNPAGMVENDSFVKLGYRFLTDGVASLIKMHGRKKRGEMSVAAQEQMKAGDAGFIQYLKADIKGSADEVRAMATTRIRDLLKRAKEGGVGISIVHSVYDTVFPMKNVQGQLKRVTPDEELVVDGFYSVKGRHGEFLMDPEKYTEVADIALDALEKKSKRVVTDI